MKLVKMNLIIACFLSTILSCFSCGNDSEYVMPDFSFLNVDKAKMYFDNEGEEIKKTAEHHYMEGVF